MRFTVDIISVIGVASLFSPAAAAPLETSMTLSRGPALFNQRLLMKLLQGPPRNLLLPVAASSLELPVFSATSAATLLAMARPMLRTLVALEASWPTRRSPLTISSSL